MGSPPLFTEGASAIHVMKMCEAMKRLGLEVELVLPAYPTKKDIFDFYGVTDRFKITKIPFANHSGRHIAHGIISAFYCYFRKNDFDFFLTRNIVFTYIATCFLGLPTIYDAHHPLVNRVAHFMFKSFKDSRYLLRFSTNSKGLADIYTCLGLDPKKLVVAPNGVDITKFRFSADVCTLREGLGLPIDKKIICYSGNTYKGRGIEYLIEAAQVIRDAHFVVVGGREEDNIRYKKIVEERRLDNFQFVGYVRHEMVPRYLVSSDVLVLPYTSHMTIRDGSNATEFTSPIKLFEYMAARKPIVATSLPSIQEILEDGKDALLVVPDSLDALVEGIKTVLSNEKLATKLSINAWNKVAGSFSWEKRVERILGLM